MRSSSRYIRLVPLADILRFAGFRIGPEYSHVARAGLTPWVGERQQWSCNMATRYRDASVVQDLKAGRFAVEAAPGSSCRIALGGKRKPTKDVAPCCHDHGVAIWKLSAELSSQN